jgi:hypothetical protein
MHGTFDKSDKTLTAPKAQRRGKSLAAAADRAAQKERDEAFRREFALAKATPVPTVGSPGKTVFC